MTSFLMGGWASSQHVGRFCPRQQTPGPKSLLFELREARTLLPVEDPCLGARSTQNLLLQGVHMSPTSFSERPGDQVTQLMRNNLHPPLAYCIEYHRLQDLDIGIRTKTYLKAIFLLTMLTPSQKPGGFPRLLSFLKSEHRVLPRLLSATLGFFINHPLLHIISDSFSNTEAHVFSTT